MVLSLCRIAGKQVVLLRHSNLCAGLLALAFIKSAVQLAALFCKQSGANGLVSLRKADLNPSDAAHLAQFPSHNRGGFFASSRQ